MKKEPIIHIIPDPNDLYQALAKDFTRRSIDAVHHHGKFTVVLSGGNTPKYFFDALTEIKYCREETPWTEIKFFFADERYVPATHAENNYHMAQEYLFSKVPVPAENIFQISTDFSDPKDAAKNYGLTLQKNFQLNKIPKFDVVYLGLGEDAHTASLMPFSDVVKSQDEALVLSLWVPYLNMYRITLTPRIINNANCIIFLVVGANKATAVWNTLKGSADPQRYPAQLIHCLNGDTIWMLDQAAGQKVR